MKRILLLLTAVILCGTLTMNGQARKTTNRPSAKARTTSAAKATPKAKAATPATPASDLPLFCLKGKVKKLTEKNLSGDIRIRYMILTDTSMNKRAKWVLSLGDQPYIHLLKMAS